MGARKDLRPLPDPARPALFELKGEPSRQCELQGLLWRSLMSRRMAKLGVVARRLQRTHVAPSALLRLFVARNHVVVAITLAG